jgi:hypothetical protein
MRRAAYASIGAGVVHGTAMGMHTEHATLAKIFIAFTLLQVGWGIWVLSNQKLWVVVSGCVVSAAAVAGWVITRTVGISFIGGLEITEKPQPADTLCAALAAFSVAAVFIAWKVLPPAWPMRMTPNALTCVIKLIEQKYGARGGTRTPTSLRTLAPEASASAISPLARVEVLHFIPSSTYRSLAHRGIPTLRATLQVA